MKAPDIDLLCEIELARAQAAENMKAEGVLLYTLVEVNVTRPLHKMRHTSKYWCEEAQRIFQELDETFWEGRAALMMVNVLHKFQQPQLMHKFAKEAYDLSGKVGDLKRQGMSLHATSLAYLNEQNTAAAVETGGKWKGLEICKKNTKNVAQYHYHISFCKNGSLTLVNHGQILLDMANN